MTKISVLRPVVIASVMAIGCGSSSSSTGISATTRTAAKVVLNPGDGCGKAVSEPREIELSCADYGLTLDGLQWTGWGARIASATGVINIHGCDPDCADDNRTYTYAAVVTAHQPVDCPGGSRQYAFIDYRSTPVGNNTDSHKPPDETRGYDCPR